MHTPERGPCVAAGGDIGHSSQMIFRIPMGSLLIHG
jgi:hypothetical protein